jgi:hypothetical protein
MEEAATELVRPVLEGAMVLAAHYCKKCGRSTVTAKDVEYGLKYAAMNITGRITESMFPEIYDGSESDESVEEVSEDTEPFTRYEGDDQYCLKANESVDTWDSWIPQTPVEVYLKRAIDSKGA